MNKKSNTSAPFNFEKAMEELEGIVLQMESGDFELEESIKQFERGVALTKLCQVALSKACLLYTSPSPRDGLLSRMPSSA